jgi:hypothetical protein
VLDYWIDGGMAMNKGIAFGWEEETPEAKARWFQSLTIEERMDLFCEFTELALQANPNIICEKDATPIEGRVLVLSKP